MMNQNQAALPQQQKGAVLVIALVMLLLLTLLGLSTIQTASKEEKMASNMQDVAFAFQATETGVVDGENWILNVTTEPVPAASCSPPCVLTYVNTRYLADESESWWNANAATLTSGTLTYVNSQPRFAVEFYRFVPDTATVGQGVPTGNYFYRVTSRGTGGSASAITVIQTTIARRF